MKRINSLNDLLMEEFAYLSNMENQLIEALPKMADASQSPALKTIFEDHVEITKGHLDRLQDILNYIGQDYQKVTCKVMKSFIEEGEGIINGTKNGPARDTAIINLAQRMERYEIDGYGIAREHAVDLGHTRMVKLLDETLDEEREMNLHLSELAQYRINVQAIDPGGSHQNIF